MVPNQALYQAELQPDTVRRAGYLSRGRGIVNATPPTVALRTHNRHTGDTDRIERFARDANEIENDALLTPGFDTT